MIYRESWAAFVTRYANALLRALAAALILRGLRNRTLFSPNWECQPHAEDHGARAEEEGPSSSAQLSTDPAKQRTRGLPVNTVAGSSVMTGSLCESNVTL